MIFFHVIGWALAAILGLGTFIACVIYWFALAENDNVVYDWFELRAERKAALADSSDSAAKSLPVDQKDIENIAFFQTVAVGIGLCFMWIVLLAAIIQIAVLVYS